MTLPVTNKQLTVIIYLMALAIIILSVMNSRLYMVNTSYQKKNRELIIQNDSILAINIILREKLQRTIWAGLANRTPVKFHHE